MLSRDPDFFASFAPLRAKNLAQRRKERKEKRQDGLFLMEPPPAGTQVFAVRSLPKG
jgi:hypothetical protein